MAAGGLIGIYLNDHLAGAVAGMEVARRSLRNNRGSPLEAPLGKLLDEIVEDRDTLQDVMAALDVRRDRMKEAAGWVVEKAARLKLNGSLWTYSPLSRLEELEGLSLGVEAKAGMWRSLAAVASGEPRLSAFDFEALQRRAAAQRASLEALRVRAARDALRPR
jgi:hypothetical protein